MLSVAQFKETYLRGMPMADQHGRPIPDSVLEVKLKAAAAAFQRKYGIRLSPTIIHSGNHLPPDELNPDGLPVVVTDAQPYDPRGFEGNRFVSLSLPYGPVREVLKVSTTIRGAQIVWHSEWLQLQRRARVLQIYPNTAAPTLLGAGYSAIAFNRAYAVPNAWEITYLAGYTEDELNNEYADVLAALGMLAAIGVLIPGSIDQFAALGINGLSASVDGLSNSTQVGNGGLRHAALIEAYKNELTEWQRGFQARSLGIRIGVL